MTVWLAILMICNNYKGTTVKCSLMADPEVYKTQEECVKKSSEVNIKFTCNAVTISKNQ